MTELPKLEPAKFFFSKSLKLVYANNSWPKVGWSVLPTCMYIMSLSVSIQNGTVVLNFTVDQTSLRGDEENFTVNVEVISMTDDPRDMDSDTTNNNQPITFNVVAMADISVTEL